MNIFNIRGTIENRFESAARWIYHNPYKILIAMLAIVVFLSLQIPSITIDTSSEALLHKTDPSLMRYNQFRDQFGRSELIIIAVTAESIFDTEFLHRLKRFHEDLEDKIPYLKEVTSLINARQTRGRGDELVVDDLLTGWPEKEIPLDELRSTVMGNPFYLNHIISEDGTVTAVIIETEATVADNSPEEDILEDFTEEEPQSEEKAHTDSHYFSEHENREVVEAIRKVVAKHVDDDFILTVSGGPVIVYAFNQATLRDVRTCIILTLIAVALFLGVLFRRLSGVLIPIFIIVATLLSTMGFMALLHTPIKITTTIIPAFLLSVGVCDSVHILAIFYRELMRHKSKEEAIVHAMGHSGLAIVMTSLTTMAGLLSFLAADLTAIAEIGIHASAGVMFALVYSIILMPAFIAVSPLKQTARSSIRATGMERFLQNIAVLSTNHARKILIAALVLLIIFAPAVFKLKFSHNIVQYFPDNSTYRNNLEYVDQNLNGTITLEVVLDTGRENGLYDPEILNGIEQFSRQTEQLRQPDIRVGKIFSITDILKETHQALNENHPDAYSIPQDRHLIAQEMLLFENSEADDLERIVDSQFSKTRITIKTPWVDAVVCRDFIRTIESRLMKRFDGQAQTYSTGLMTLLARAISAAIFSMAKSYGIALFVITIMMIFMLGSIRMGLISMIPNLLPIIMTMGLMGWMEIPLDINSLMIGSIALGVVVDDTVHFMYNFQKYYDKRPQAAYAIRKTLTGTGRALLITSLVLCTGFFILMTASLNHLVRFGLFTGTTILFALIADFLLAPALMTMIKRQKPSVLES